MKPFPPHYEYHALTLSVARTSLIVIKQHAFSFTWVDKLPVYGEASLATKFQGFTEVEVRVKTWSLRRKEANVYEEYFSCDVQ